MAVHVVVDNCTDRTAEIVRANGFEVHERDRPDDPGKGPALQWLMARLRERGEVPDAVVVVDADTVVEPGFLEAADRRLATGADVVQGHYAVRDSGDSPLVAFRAAAMAARTYLRPLGRDAIGGSAGLHGNGMVFRSEVFGRHPWTHHLTEDVEQHLQLLLDGTLVRFAPDAVLEAEMPTTLAASRTQHERWEGGRFDLARRYVPTLLRRAVVGGEAPRRAYLDAALDQFVPPLSIALVASAGWGAIGAIRTLRSRRGGTLDLAVAGTSTAVLVAHVLTALRLTNAPPSQYRALLMTPRLVIWKLGLWARVVARPSTAQWTRTTRNIPASAAAQD
jgi:cellulose synthase/poly-beta-1,6-N-acetylglucosamine synthase-like glycosyltransferase